MLPITELLHPSNPRVLVAAHRGAWRWAPENSIPAIDEAVALGADIVELDVRASADGVLVLMHDATLDRMTTLQGAVKDTPYAHLREARLRGSDGGPDHAVTTHAVPTLSQALEAARDRIAVNIDTKDPVLADRIAQLVVVAGLCEQVFVKATVTAPEHLGHITASPYFGRVPFVPMTQAVPGRFVQDLQWMQALACPMYEVGFNDLDTLAGGISLLRQQQARLWVNTIDCSHSLDFNDSHARNRPDAVWGRLVDLGVGAIQTDDVDLLVSYLSAQGQR
jgi:glycerophosphoryl diester phosphodiesterase